MKKLILWIGAIALHAWPLQIASAAAPVEMITDTEELQPASTLEFRFETPMIAADDVGLTVEMEAAPIQITPAIDGNFTWLSRSSGVFTTTQAWPLGGSFTFSLRAGLMDAEGKKLRGNFKQTLRTPAFAQTVFRGGGGETCDPVPEMLIAYNLAVDAASAAPLFRFVKEDGTEIAAKVSHQTLSYFSVPIEHDDWEKRWRMVRGIPAGEVESGGTPYPNRLSIMPVTPLSPGTWSLTLTPGLTSKDGKHRLSTSWTQPFGRVEPFDISELRPANYAQSGRSLTVDFSHELAPDITPETAHQFLTIEPPVKNLRFEGWGREFIARGDFELDREYRLLVGDDFISANLVPFQGQRSRSFRFDPVKPRLYLPSITASQIQSGKRSFEVLSANLRALKVVARLVEPADAAAAIDAFRKYERETADYEAREYYQPLPVYSFRSERISERRIELPAKPLDTKEMTSVDWNEVLGERKTGVIFLTVEGEPRAEVGGKNPAAQALIQLTDLGVMWKKISEGLQVSVFSMETGKPLANSTVILLDQDFQPIREELTGADGVATPTWPEEAKWLMVRKDADVHALRIGEMADELPMHAFNVPLQYSRWASFGELSVDVIGI